MSPGKMQRARRAGIRALGLALAALLLIAGLLLVMQHRLIYHPRPYGSAFAERFPKNGVELRYRTSQGAQFAFYIPPAEGAPQRIWAMFGGNGSLALDWTFLLSKAAPGRDGFLLLDYPGYGKCEGRASPAAIAESSEKAAQTLAAQLHVSPAALEEKWDVIGHSLGCATGLQFAARHPVGRVILIAPFTSTLDMARRIVGWPLCNLLTHRFDNRTRLAELTAREHPPRVFIFHGSADRVIPVKMGRALAAEFPRIVTCHEVPGADHNSILFTAEPEILRAMTAPLPPR